MAGTNYGPGSIVNDVYGETKMGRVKHGGPHTHYAPEATPEHAHRAWLGTGVPWVRSTMRAKDDVPATETLQDVNVAASVKGYIEEYKEAMIEMGRGDEVSAAAEDTSSFQLDEDLPEEAKEAMRKAFAENDSEALAQAMTGLDRYDPKHKSFDDRIRFWQTQFQKAWSDEFQKDQKQAKSFVMDSLTPFMPADYAELKKLEEKKVAQLALERKKKEAAESGQLQALDFTDSYCAILQATEQSTAWESQSCMGANAGLMFGAHCCATMEFGQWDECNEHWSVERDLVDNAKRYPRPKGRLYQSDTYGPCPPSIITSKEDYTPAMQEILEEQKECRTYQRDGRVVEIDDWIRRACEPVASSWEYM